MTNYLDPQDLKPVHFERDNAAPEQCHVFDKRSVTAINASLAAGRPLLILGEPGVGKSQLARAAARKLGRVFISVVVDSKTDSRDLMYRYDAVQRLADAQVKAALAISDKALSQRLVVELAATNYLVPGPLWWAFDWESAAAQPAASPPPQEPNGPGEPKAGAVLLIDEVDKGQTELPNGLLEALGDGCFSPDGFDQTVTIGQIPPLVVITSNDERQLPAAFVRRCLVLRLSLPESVEKLQNYLLQLADVHQPMQSLRVKEKAAELLVGDRSAAREADARPLPGLAEYFDMLRVLQRQYPDNETAQLEAIEAVAQFTSGKHRSLQP